MPPNDDTFFKTFKSIFYFTFLVIKLLGSRGTYIFVWFVFCCTLYTSTATVLSAFTNTSFIYFLFFLLIVLKPLLLHLFHSKAALMRFIDMDLKKQHYQSHRIF